MTLHSNIIGSKKNSLGDVLIDKNLLVQIFVPTSDPDGKGSIGTGYPVAPGRILTARHVLFPENRVPKSLGEVRWYHLNGVLREWRPITNIVWQDVNMDVTVIECDFPGTVKTYGMLTRSKPKTDARWESEGFAKVGKKEGGTCPPVPLKGATYSMGEQGVFHLGVDDPAYQPSAWKGASGSPVFVDGKIQGVIVIAQADFPANRLAATPSFKLLNEPSFRQAIGWREPDRTADIVKPTPFYLASLVNTDHHFEQIKKVTPTNSNLQGGQALAFVFADFEEECPDSINYKLLHRLGSPLMEPCKLLPKGEAVAPLKAADFLWAMLQAKLHADAATAEYVKQALEKSDNAWVFVHELSDQHAADQPFIADVVRAWESLHFAADRPCHFLILLHEKQESVNLWQRWRLRRWIACVKNRLAEMGCRVINPLASPAILSAHVKSWVEREVSHYEALSYQQENDLKDRVANHFDKPKQRKSYLKIRTEIQNDLKAVLYPAPVSLRES